MASRALAYLKGEGAYGDRKKFPFPTLLLLDIKMPKMNGLEVLSAVRQDPALKRLVVIILTSSNQRRDINEAFDLKRQFLPRKTSGHRWHGQCALEKNSKKTHIGLKLNQYPPSPLEIA